MAVDLKMYRKGLDPKKTIYQIEKEKEEADEKEIEQQKPRKRGRPRKNPK